MSLPQIFTTSFVIIFLLLNIGIFLGEYKARHQHRAKARAMWYSIFSHRSFGYVAKEDLFNIWYDYWFMDRDKFYDTYNMHKEQADMEYLSLLK